ncbi:PAS domain S-box-containing protein [Fluviicoccus keumensis]|uniref:PAS domain S-box-containing protein n=1 Tax=Fluviicoccus keumensis TaxID=1435465 RepID=A0A4Q7Z5Z0_9GAMM|nr:EAL domain-containing protein [Fluviicoccus keumensis]RZU45089.1 PAS domain S-box-containing protein [Fluviicoccus keumensis]
MEEVRILLLEDMAFDAELVQANLRQAGIGGDIRRVLDEAAFREALAAFRPDVILADYHVPGFGGLEALHIRNELAPATPYIFVTGSLGEEKAVETLREGATDFVLKDRMARLGSAVGRALADARRQAELEAERVLHNTILNTAQAMIVALDEHGHVLHANAAAAVIAGRPAADITGQPFWECFVDSADMPATRLRITAIAEEVLEAETSWRMVSRLGRVVVWTAAALQADRHPEARLVLCGIDITDQQRAQEKAYYLDHFDAATGLPNRRLFQLQLQQYCDQHGPGSNGRIVTMIVGLDRIQAIRDSYDDAVIQKLLAETVQRLRTWQVHHELLARIDDLSFALAFEIEHEKELEQTIPFVLNQLHEPIEIDGTSWVLPCHAGISLSRPDLTAFLLVREAEAALHDAQARHLPFVIYNAHLSKKARERLLLETELHQIPLHPEQLTVYFQPQVDARTHRLIGLEALVRWRHPRLGLILPGRFVPIAESAGLMPDLGREIIRITCRQIQDWQEAGLTVPPVAVNISADEFASPGLVERVEHALLEFDIAPQTLELELTESASMQNPEATIAIMNRLCDLGVRLSIDDFGTGYSNLSYLKRFPVSRLKLDQAFVRDILTDNHDLAISQAIIAMAHQLRLEVVAEGVENVAQLKLLSQARCDFIQGYLFSTPQPGEVCRRWLREGMVSPTTPVLPD